MAATISLVEAADALCDRFGSRLEAGYDDGQDIMADALRKHFNISRRAARKLVDDLEHARTIRYRPGTRSTMSGRPGGAAAGVAPDVSSPAVSGIGQPFIPMYEGSYWQIAPSD